MQTMPLNTSRNRLTGLLTGAFFVVAVLEVIAEYSRSTTAVFVIKPFLIPLLALLYWCSSPKPNKWYLAGLFFCWVSNILFIWKDFSFIVAATCFVFIYRFINISLVFKNIVRPGIFPIFVGSIPFFFMYLYLIYVANGFLQQGMLIFILQCLIITFLGGVSVGNHILNPSKTSLRLLISTLFFSLVQFMFVFREYYTTINFQPIAMALFILGQYLFYRFMLGVEIERPKPDDSWRLEQ
jgi:hypothetical protein